LPYQTLPIALCVCRPWDSWDTYLSAPRRCPIRPEQFCALSDTSAFSSAFVNTWDSETPLSFAHIPFSVDDFMPLMGPSCASALHFADTGDSEDTYLHRLHTFARLSLSVLRPIRRTLQLCIFLQTLGTSETPNIVCERSMLLTILRPMEHFLRFSSAFADAGL
jgi:hypothetical protein